MLATRHGKTRRTIFTQSFSSKQTKHKDFRGMVREKFFYGVLYGVSNFILISYIFFL